MPKIKARVIHCPKKTEHIHPKILLVVNDDYLSVYCGEHGWIKIELKRGDKVIDFSNVSAKLNCFGKNVTFDLSPIPALAIGNFKSKRKCYGEHIKK